MDISNSAGLSAIRYRIGDFTSFRGAMLAAMSDPDLLAGGATSLQAPVNAADTTIAVIDSGSFPATAPFRIKIDDEYLEVLNCLTPTKWTVARSARTTHDIDSFVTLVPANPFANWEAGVAGDYQTMFVELWAYLADILTFYQERVANEAYVGTASLRDSLLRLVNLIDYRPGPGAGAGGWVTFTAAANRSLTVPAGFRVASRPQPEKPSVTFETTSPIAAVADNNAIPLSLVSPEIPFSAGTVVIEGTDPGVSAGDYLVIVDRVGVTPESANLVRVTGATADLTRGVTTISWHDLQNRYTQASKQAVVNAFHIKATPFGSNAPLWDSLSPVLTKSPALYPISWETRTLRRAISFVAGGGFAIGTELAANDWFFIPTPLLPGPGVDLSAGNGVEPADQLFLDQVYSELTYSQSNPGVAVLLTDDVNEILTVIDARSAAKTAYGIAGSSTRLTFDHPFPLHTFPLRNTIVLTGNHVLPLHVDLPIPEPVTGSSLTLAGIHSQLQDGQTVVVSGNLFDPTSNLASATVVCETAILDGAPQPDPINGVTLVKLKHSLRNQYSIATCVLSGNVAEITQGETVKDEILGNGDGTAFQSFLLKKIPLTYLPSTDPEGLSAVKSTLSVRVNRVEWREEPNLATSAPDDPVFVTTLDDSGQTTVVFGDGFNGARPPTGVDNIHARYRNGLGAGGNLPSGAVQQLVDSVANLQKVDNPIPTTGGADPENAAGIRKNAPGSLQTFGRAVTAADYAALASGYPGIAKASAAWIVQDPVNGLAVPHPYVQLTAAAIDRVPLQGTSLASNLRRFLDGRRDTNVLLRIRDFTPVYLAVTVEVTIRPQYPHQETLNKVNAVLNAGVNPDGSLGLFAFDRLGFGEPIFLSSVYAAVQAVPGVENAVITTLARVSSPADPSSAAPHDIFLGPTEVAVIDSSAVPASALTVIGKGGFAI